MSDRKNTIFLSVIGVATLLVAIVGATFAWFSTTVEGEGTEVEVTTVELGTITFNETAAVNLTNAYPGESASRTFTITAPTLEEDSVVNYGVALTVANPELAAAADTLDDSLVHTLTCTPQNGGTGASMSETTVPGTAATHTLATNGVLKSGEVHECVYTITLTETGENQNDLQGLTFAGTLSITGIEDNKYTAGGTQYNG